MNLNQAQHSLLLQLIAGRDKQEAALFGPREAETLLGLIEAKILKENTVIFWQTTLGATQNLAVEDFLDEEGKRFFTR
jgi:hypothetical protein